MDSAYPSKINGLRMRWYIKRNNSENVKGNVEKKYNKRLLSKDVGIEANEKTKIK